MIEYISNNLWLFWAAIAVICMIIELFTIGFFIICFSVGAMFAMLASFFFGIYIQLAIFVIFSTLSIFLVRPFALRYLHKKEDNTRKANADALIGRKGVVSQTIHPESYGRVAVGGEDWKAEAEPGELIEAGTPVRIVGRESIIIKVTKL